MFTCTCVYPVPIKCALYVMIMCDGRTPLVSDPALRGSGVGRASDARSSSSSSTSTSSTSSSSKCRRSALAILGSPLSHVSVSGRL